MRETSLPHQDARSILKPLGVLASSLSGGGKRVRRQRIARFPDPLLEQAQSDKSQGVWGTASPRGAHRENRRAQGLGESPAGLAEEAAFPVSRL